MGSFLDLLAEVQRQLWDGAAFAVTEEQRADVHRQLNGVVAGHLPFTAKAAPEPRKSRHRKHNARLRTVRARTVNLERMPKGRLELERALALPADHWRPSTRAECVDAPRPCPYAGCRFHLYLDVSPETGSFKINFPDLEAWELTESCALDVADRGGVTLETVAVLMNLTRERVRQIEAKALKRLGKSRVVKDLLGSLGTEGPGDPEPLLRSLGSTGTKGLLE